MSQKDKFSDYLIYDKDCGLAIFKFQTNHIAQFIELNLFDDF